jgi:tRNA modification GTPase
MIGNMATETIFAPSTAPGKAGVAVVRVSGSEAKEALEQIAGLVPVPRAAQLAMLRDPRSREVLDKGLVLFFPAPHSFTGEDVAEFQIHGSRAVVAGLIGALVSIPGLRLAEPGEFVRRAFENGKMDLAETEALADLLAAETAAQRRQALNGLESGLGPKAEAWRGELIQAQALIEAEIDFPDEGDVPAGLIARAQEIASALSQNIHRVLAAPDGARLREGAVVVIAGPPNVGKSSFLNRVAKREVAIVTPHAGTTRDLLELPLDLGGFPVALIDTAGFRDATDPVEIEAIERAAQRAASADLVLWFSDDPRTDSVPSDFANLVVWGVRTKADLQSADAGQRFIISAATGSGISELLSALSEHLASVLTPQELALVTRRRHRDALEEARRELQACVSIAEPELLAEVLRRAARSLGRISGRVDVEDVLDAVFGSFCIGK